MNTNELVFVGIKGSAVALNRGTGEIAWQTHLSGSGFVHLVLDDENLYATTAGEIFCLDSATGEGRWHNKLKGFGLGLASIAAKNGSDDGGVGLAAMAQEHERVQQQHATPVG